MVPQPRGGRLETRVHCSLLVPCTIVLFLSEVPLTKLSCVSWFCAVPVPECCRTRSNAPADCAALQTSLPSSSGLRLTQIQQAAEGAKPCQSPRAGRSLRSRPHPLLT